MATTRRKSRGRSHGDADADLREDIRFLGRLLGDTIREQAGAEVFDLVESIRRTAIRYRQGARCAQPEAPGADDRPARRRARDQRRARVQLLPSPGERRRGSARAARAARRGNHRAWRFERLRAAHVPTRKIVAFFERARVEPVLTAHPTEVQRKSILDRHRADHRPARARAARRPPRRHREGAAPRGASCCGRPTSCAWPSRPSPTRSRTGSPTSGRRSWRPSRASTPRSRTASAPGRAWRRSCASRAGSAAIATATRTSPPR